MACNWIVLAGEDGSIHEEYDEDDHFIGQRRDCLTPSFGVSRDLYEDYFIAVRPADGDSYPQAKSNPNYNPEWPNYVLIQYFPPTSRSQLVQETYRGWDSEVGLHGKIKESNDS